MLPLRLKLSGFYSYQDEQVIDFGPLIDARLFGIFGETGSGKSTLLEAMTLALYGDTRVPKNPYAELMNLERDHLLVELEFEALGQIYQFSHSVVRSKTKQGELKYKPLRRALRKTADGWETLDEKRFDTAETILNIQKDDFKRTIIIPQGEFSDFFSQATAKRSEIIKRLFPLEQYDLSDSTKHLLKQTEGELRLIEGQLQQLQRSTPEELELLRAQIAENEANQKTYRETLQQFDTTLQRLTALQQLIKQVQAAQQAHQQLQQRQSEIDQRNERLKTYLLCVQQFKDLLTEIQQQTNQLQQQQSDLDAATVRHQQQKEALEALQPQLIEAKANFAAIAQWKTESQEWQWTKDILTATQEMTALQVRIENAESYFLKSDGQMAEIKALLIQSEQNDEQLQAQRNKEAQWITYQNWHTQLADKQTSVQKAQQQLQKAQQELETTQQALAAQLPAAAIAEPAAYFQQTAQALTQRQADLQMQLTHLLAQTKLTDQAQALVDGQPCPLCGATHHPNPLQADDLQHAQKEIKQSIKDSQSQSAALEMQRQSWQASRIVLQGLQRDIERANDNIQSAQQQLTAHSAQQPFPAADADSYTVEAIQAALQAITAAKTAQEQIKKNIAALKKDKEGKEKEINRCRIAYDEFKQKHTNLSATESQLLKQIQHLPIEQSLSLDTSAIDTQIQQLQLQISTAEQTWTSLQAQEKQLSQSVIALSEKIKTITPILEQGRKQLLEREAIFNQRLIDQQIPDKATVEAQLALRLNVAQEQAAIEQHQQQSLKVSQQLAEYQRQHQEQFQQAAYDESQHKAIQLQKQQTQQTLDNVSQQIGSLTAQLASHEADLTEYQRLSVVQTSLQHREGDLKVLERLFQGNRFVDFAATVYLEQLAHMANQYLSTMNGNAFQIAFGANSDWRIIDLLHGGHERAYHTLSGGEKFQASLSMALALSGNIRQLAQQDYRFFFIDEGFGTLDPKALAAVMQTLRRLTQQGYIIGIISHQPTLQEEMDIHLLVEKDTEKRSRVIPSHTYGGQ
jgi:DNA repair protein SbcC/Rad50